MTQQQVREILIEAEKKLDAKEVKKRCEDKYGRITINNIRISLRKLWDFYDDIKRKAVINKFVYWYER